MFQKRKLNINDRKSSFIRVYKKGGTKRIYVYECENCKCDINRTAFEEKNSTQLCEKCIPIFRPKKIKANYDSEGNKKCNICLRFLPISKFITKGRNYSSSCSKCHNSKKYGINALDYEKILEQQNYVCAICEQPELANDKHKDYKRSLAIDHCHTTNKVRGLLCTKCNILLGQSNDDINRLYQAIEYLKRNS